ncbi:hypothetical protein [Lysobacter sp. A289]
MNTHSHFPDQRNWISQDLADAIPPRLFEQFAVDASLMGVAFGDCHNQPPRRAWPHSYLPTDRPPLFHVHS